MVSNTALAQILRAHYKLNIHPDEIPALLQMVGHQIIASHFQRDSDNYWITGVVQAHGGDPELLHNNIKKNLMRYEIPG